MGKMNDIGFTKTNGGMGRTAESGDPISGVVMYLPELAAADLINQDNAKKFSTVTVDDGDNNSHTLYVAKLKYVEELADYGMVKKELKMQASDYEGTTDAEKIAAFKKVAAVNMLVYTVSKFFDMNEQGTLYLAIKNATDSQVNGVDLAALQNWANGAIRQCGVVTPSLTYTTGSGNGAVTYQLLPEYQKVCTDPTSGLEVEHKPMSVVVAVSGKDVKVVIEDQDIVVTPEAITGFELSDLTSSNIYVVAGRCNVSLLIGCDLDANLTNTLGHYAYYGCIGTCMGAISKAAVHECIAWVKKFPLGLVAPGLITGQLIKDVSTAKQNMLNDNRYLFVRTHVGNADNYFNDSHTLDEATSDYACIENVRTIDKACRGIYEKILPHLCSPLKVNAETGKLDEPTVAFLETTAGEALEDMEKAGELSGYRAEIDPDQNVIATGTVEVIVKKVPMGVMRKINVKIGFATKL